MYYFGTQEYLEDPTVTQIRPDDRVVHLDRDGSGFIVLTGTESGPVSVRVAAHDFEDSQDLSGQMVAGGWSAAAEFTLRAQGTYALGEVEPELSMDEAQVLDSDEPCVHVRVFVRRTTTPHHTESVQEVHYIHIMTCAAPVPYRQVRNPNVPDAVWVGMDAHERSNEPAQEPTARTTQADDDPTKDPTYLEDVQWVAGVVRLHVKHRVGLAIYAGPQQGWGPLVVDAHTGLTVAWDWLGPVPDDHPPALMTPLRSLDWQGWTPQSPNPWIAREHPMSIMEPNNHAWLAGPLGHALRWYVYSLSLYTGMVVGGSGCIRGPKLHVGDAQLVAYFPITEVGTALAKAQLMRQPYGVDSATERGLVLLSAARETEPWIG